MKIKYDSLIKYFFISVVVGVGISYSKLYFFHIMIIALIFFYLYKHNFILILVKPPTKLHYIFYFMFIWYFISVIWSIKVEYYFRYLFYLFCGISIVLVSIFYMNTIEKQNKIFKVVSFVFILEIIFSLLESFTDFRLPISPFSSYLTYFGREIKYDINLNISVISMILGSPTGFEWNPNNLAITMLIISPFFLTLKKLKIKFIGLSSIFIIIMMAGSRGVFVSFIFMLFLYFSLLNIKRFIASILIIPLISILFIFNADNLKTSDNQRVREMAYAFDTLNTYLFKDVSNNQESIGERQLLIKNGLDALKNSNYIGVGGGGSQAVQENKGGVADRLASMHNFWIEMLVDSGVFFTLIFLIWYGIVLFKLYSIAIKTKNAIFKYYAESLFLSMMVFLPGAISASSVIYMLPMWLMYGFAIATINNFKRHKHDKHEVIATFRS